MFKRYNKIRNGHNSKYVCGFVDANPELRSATFVLQEKLHGANFQIGCDKNGKLSYGRRSAELNKNESFYGYQAVISLIRADLRKMRNWCKKHLSEVILHGELFGGNIQKGVDYGKEKRVLFFDVRVNGRIEAPKNAADLMKEWCIEHLMVPVFGYVDSLDNALSFSVEGVDSLILNKPNNNIEGVVAKPFNRVYRWIDDIFYIKLKSKSFLEAKARPKKKSTLPDNIAELKHSFSEFICDARLANVFSKHGRASEMTEIGKFIRLLILDAKEEFIQVNPHVEDLDKNTQKIIFNVGSLAAGLVRKAIQES